MDGQLFTSTLRDPDFIKGRERPRVGVFLQRDLNEHALRLPPPPVFSEAELAVVRQEGFDAGRVAGLTEAAISRAAAEAAALGIIGNHLADAQAQATRVAEQAAAALAKTLIMALDAVMPDLIRRSSLNEANAMLSHVLPGLSREAHVGIEVASEIAPGVAAALARLALDCRDRIGVTGLDDFPAGEVRVRWACGHARREPVGIWQGVMDVLEPALAEPRLKESDDGE